jgi:DNA uptake protein ComE-like DNA-binding protein
MRTFALLLALAAGPVAGAKEATVAAADSVQDIRAVGRLNVNHAAREQLLKVPGVDAALADALIARREAAPIRDLAGLGLPESALAHLKTDGESNFYRLVQLPLVRLDAPSTAAR